MQALKTAILEQGEVYPGNILKVDAFLNHQIDPLLMYRVGQAFYDQFKDQGISKILTIEASGIAPAIMASLAFKVPLVFAKKQQPATLQEGSFYTADVFSYTKKTSSTICVAKTYLQPEDRVLIIDDFLANGQAALGLLSLVQEASASCAGIGIVIEKAFQPGRQLLEDRGFAPYSLCKLKALVADKPVKEGGVVFED